MRNAPRARVSRSLAHRSVIPLREFQAALRRPRPRPRPRPRLLCPPAVSFCMASGAADQRGGALLDRSFPLHAGVVLSRWRSGSPGGADWHVMM